MLDFFKKGQFPSIDWSADTGNELTYKGYIWGNLRQLTLIILQKFIYSSHDNNSARLLGIFFASIRFQKVVQLFFRWQQKLRFIYPQPQVQA